MHQLIRKLYSLIFTLTLLALATGCDDSQSTQKIAESTGASSPSASPDQSQDTAVEFSNKSRSQSSYGVGEVIGIKNQNLNLQFKVNGIREHPGKGVIKPNQGQKWILVDTTIANQGKEAKTFSLVSFELMDSENKQYEVALLAGALDDVNSPTGEIKPGEELQGELVFEVPQKAQGLKLIFNPNLSGCPVSEKVDCESIVVKLE